MNKVDEGHKKCDKFNTEKYEVEGAGCERKTINPCKEWALSDTSIFDLTDEFKI